MPLLLAALVACTSGSDPLLPTSGEPIRHESPRPSLELGKTDVLLVMVDTLRADRLGAWGNPHRLSPNIDTLATAGVRFSSFYVNSSWTRPSMAGLLTGLHPRTTGIHEEQFDILAEELTPLAERFTGAGYLSLGLTANPNLNDWFGFAQGFAEYGDSGVVWRWMNSEGQKYKPNETELDTADFTTNRALALLDRNRKALASQPFYLQVVYIDPHFPYAPPEPHKKAAQAAGSATPLYDGEIRYTDEQVGRLMDGLEERGLLHNTLVILVSDHGEGLNSHPDTPLSDRHGATLYDSVLHVPLILKHPLLPAGAVVQELGAGVDLVPTVFDLLGSQPAGLPGRSLVPAIRNEPHQPRNHVISETDWRSNLKRSLRTPGGRYVRNLDSTAWRKGIFEGTSLKPKEKELLAFLPDEEFYLLEPFESERPMLNNVLADHREEADAAWAILEAFDRDIPTRLPQRRSPEDVLTLADGTTVSALSGRDGAGEHPDEATIERLRALGYIEQ
jgi:arylsulfatase A-like enzyme